MLCYLHPLRATDLRVAPDVVHVAAQQVAQAVGHEDGAQAGLHHVVHVAPDDTQLQQLLQVDAVGQKVHVGPLHTWTKGQRSPGSCGAPFHSIKHFKTLFYKVVTINRQNKYEMYKIVTHVN